MFFLVFWYIDNVMVDGFVWIMDYGDLVVDVDGVFGWFGNVEESLYKFVVVGVDEFIKFEDFFGV